jgi:pimeloyl-ACP methyl ester carboxylesterase
MTPDAVEIKAADGVILRGLVWGGHPDRAILLHDAGETADLDDWRPLIPTLLGQDLTVLAVDLRGHGASDGEWDPEACVADIAAVVRASKTGGVVIVAAGAAATAAVCAMELEPVDGLILLSPLLSAETAPPRGAGVSKLVVAGALDPESRAAMDRLRIASIGWAVAVNLPTTEQGTDLLGDPWGGHVREQTVAFIRERRFMMSNGNERAPLSESFLVQAGLKPAGKVLQP